MKKIITTLFILSVLITSCGTHASQGAYTGLQIGSVLGSAIGGLSDGWRGSNIGTITGMVGGAVVGGAIGNAYDKSKENNKKKERDKDYDNESYQKDDYRERHVDIQHSSREFNSAELRNIMLYDADDNGILSGDEDAEIEFEVYNKSSEILYDVTPVFEQTSNNKHIITYTPQPVDKINPGASAKFTAYIKAGHKLKNGTAQFCISVYNSYDKLLAPKTKFEVETKRERL